MGDPTSPIVVNGRTLDRSGSASGRVCAVCRKPKACMAHTIQADDGMMRSIFVHLSCLKSLLAERRCALCGLPWNRCKGHGRGTP
jgi:hypothetical protein